MIKRAISLVLALCMCLSLALAAEGEGISIVGAKVNIAGDFQYSGRPVDVSALDVTVTLDGRTLKKDTDFIIVEDSSDYVSAGEQTVEIQGIGDYYGSAYGSFEISPLTVTVTDVVLSDKVFDGTCDGEVSAVRATTADGEKITLPEDCYTAQVIYNDANAGDGRSATVELAPRGEDVIFKGNCEFSFNNLTIKKGHEAIIENVEIYYKSDEERVIDLEDVVARCDGYMPSDSGLTYEIVKKNSAFKKAEISDGRLTIALDTSKTKANGSATLNVAVYGMSNLESLDIGVFVSFAKTAPLEIDMSFVNVSDKVYDGEPYPAVSKISGKAYATGYDGKFTYKWVTYTGQVMDKPPVNAGQYGIMATPSDSKFSGQGIKYFEIYKKSLTVAPKNVVVEPGGTVPEFTLEYDGVVSGESISPSIAPKFKLYDKNGREISAEDAVKTRGEYKIVWVNSEGVTFGNAKNYDIKTVAQGVLYVGDPTECDGTDCVSAAFSDVDTNLWYHQAICFAVKKGIMQGVSGNKFAPDATLTRAQLAQILYNLEGKPEASGELPFTDVAEGAWYRDAVLWAYNEGIVSGKSETAFAPNENITREALCLMLYRYAGSPKASGSLSAPDKKSVSSWAKTAVIWATREKVINGDSRGNLNPQGNATRAQVAQIFMNYLSE